MRAVQPGPHGRKPPVQPRCRSTAAISLATRQASPCMTCSPAALACAADRALGGGVAVTLAGVVPQQTVMSSVGAGRQGDRRRP
jgi:hypothetical protein